MRKSRFSNSILFVWLIFSAAVFVKYETENQMLEIILILCMTEICHFISSMNSQLLVDDYLCLRLTCVLCLRINSVPNVLHKTLDYKHDKGCHKMAISNGWLAKWHCEPTCHLPVNWMFHNKKNFCATWKHSKYFLMIDMS